MCERFVLLVEISSIDLLVHVIDVRILVISTTFSSWLMIIKKQQNEKRYKEEYKIKFRFD